MYEIDNKRGSVMKVRRAVVSVPNPVDEQIEFTNQVGWWLLAGTVGVVALGVVVYGAVKLAELVAARRRYAREAAFRDAERAARKRRA